MAGRDDGEVEVVLRMSEGQARAVEVALDLYNRLCIGQFEEVESLVRLGTIPLQRPQGSPRETAGDDACERVRDHLKSIKRELGYDHSGHNGIGHRHVHLSGHRAYEVQKALSQALAYHNDPNPRMLNLNYDGLIVRYTSDRAPVATVSPSATPPLNLDAESPAPRR